MSAVSRLRGWLPVAAHVVVWLTLSSLAAAGFFLTSERTVDLVVGGHTHVQALSLIHI